MRSQCSGESRERDSRIDRCPAAANFPAALPKYRQLNNNRPGDEVERSRAGLTAEPVKGDCPDQAIARLGVNSIRSIRPTFRNAAARLFRRR